jgi:regulator of RNase E activity RraA
MIFNSPDRVAAITAAWTGERSADGRPRVSDDLVERMKLVTNDEAYNIMERQHGYQFQFAGDWFNLHPELSLSGRAVTAAFVPKRPDLHDAVQEDGAADGRNINAGQNTWVIDTLQPGDVLVVDLFGKVHDGTFIGDNLATATRSRTGTGIVIDGGIRDYQRVNELDDFAVYCRGVDPTAIADVTLVGVNIPIMIGNATVLPGDIVLGTRSGVTFVPPHLAEEVIVYSEDIRQRDVFGKQRLAEQIYNSGQIDVSKWADEIEADYRNWLANR